MEYTITYTINDDKGGTATFSHKLAFDEIIPATFSVTPSGPFTIYDGIPWSYTYPTVNTGTYIYFAAMYSGDDILGSVITTTLPFTSYGNYPWIGGARLGLNSVYQSWVDDEFEITLDYDGTTSLASLIGLTTLEIKMNIRDTSRYFAASEYITSVNVKVP